MNGDEEKYGEGRNLEKVWFGFRMLAQECADVRFWLCVTSIAGANGATQLYER